jgi:hypothetical protein
MDEAQNVIMMAKKEGGGSLTGVVGWAALFQQ